MAIGLIALTITPFAFAQGEVAPKATLPDIEDEVMCPVCGTTLELASDTQQAIDEREFIRNLIAEGRTKDEIKDALVAEFGEEVLATPGTEGFDLAAWVVPVLAALLGGGAVFLAVRRWRASTLASAGGGDLTSAGVAKSPRDDADERRLDADLKRYEL